MSSIDARRNQIAREANAIPVRESSVDETKVVTELKGWYQRYCLDRAEEAKKQMQNASYGVGSRVEGIDLTARLATGERQDQVNGWIARAEAANNGVFLFDQAAMRSPQFMSDSSIRGLHERASALGLAVYERESQELGNRF